MHAATVTWKNIKNNENTTTNCKALKETSNNTFFVFCIFVFVFTKDWGEQDKTCTLVHAVRTLNLMGGEVAKAQIQHIQQQIQLTQLNFELFNYIIKSGQGADTTANTSQFWNIQLNCYESPCRCNNKYNNRYIQHI